MSLKNIISKSNETEEKALESKHVLLWGLNKVSSKLMKKAEAEFKPTKRAYTKKEGVVEKVKVHRYDPTNEDYTEEDLPFLNKEYERISAIVDNPKTDEEEEEAVDLQDKLYDLIDQLESVSKFRKKTEGKGISHQITHIISGRAVSSKHIKKFIDASYDKNPSKNIDQYNIDEELSNEHAKTYHDPKTGHTVVVHRGTSGASDWLNNLSYGLGRYKKTDRYKTGKDIQNKANEKYGAENISTLGHSQGAILARELGKGGKEVITLNPAYMGEKEGDNEHTIRSSSDVVSGLKNYLKGGNDTTIKSKNPFNILGEHSSDILDRMNPDQMIGNGLNEDMLKHLVSHITDPKEKLDKRDAKQAKQLINKITMKGGAITKGSPEALARADKMRLGKEAKRIAEGKPPPKGKYVKKEKILKPYYNIGEIPTGFREATEREAIENGKLSHWGKYQVNPEVMKEFKNVGFFFSKDLTEEQAKTLISRMMTRMKGAIRDIPYVNNRLENIHDKGENSKYYKKKAEIEEEGLQLKNRYKTASKMVDVLVKHIKTINPKFTGVIKPSVGLRPNRVNEVPKPEASKEEMREVDDVPEIEVPIERDFRKRIAGLHPSEAGDARIAGLHPSEAGDAPIPKEKKITKTQLMDSFTHMTKEGKKVDIETKVHIHKDKINPKIKSVMRESLLNEFDKEIIGHGIVKHDEMIKERDIQSILFKRPEWTKAKAIKWLKEHDFEFDDIDTKPEHLRFRQKEPNNGYSYITKKLPNGIDLIIGYKIMTTNNKYNEMNHHGLIKHHMDGLEMALHGAGLGGSIGSFFRDMGHSIDNTIIQPAKHVAENVGGETEHFGSRTLPSYLIHKGIPAVTQGIGTAAGSPAGFFGGVAGGMAGKEAGERLANYTGDKTGYGIRGRGMMDYLTHGIIDMPEGGGYLTHGIGGAIKAPYGDWASQTSRRDNMRPTVMPRSPSESPPRRVGAGFKKGSAEAKAHMARIRAMKKK